MDEKNSCGAVGFINFGPENIIPSHDLKECTICSRMFTLERLAAHEDICKKNGVNKRKAFDVSLQRIRGTEAEICANLTAKNECPENVEKTVPCGLSTNWRGKHEDLLSKVKEAKNRASGSSLKISDLPFPPPPDDDSPYIQCEHCLRLFNEASAQRHIPICASKRAETEIQ